MAEITEKKINDAIKSCKWRQDFMGTDICAGDVLPCRHLIEQGKCDTLRRLFAEHKEADNG